MQFQKVESSNIKALAHEDDTLAVQFHGGSEYHYDNVPAFLFDELIGAESVGRTFNQLIKSKPVDYPHRKVA